MKITRHDSIDSTNSAIKEAIRAGAAEGTVVMAREQKRGYGRQGREWTSPRGGLYFSILLRPQDQDVPQESLPTLSLVISLAIRQALTDDLAQATSDGQVDSVAPIFVKWPNDIFCGDKKLVGISLESLGSAVCIGIGVNVFPPDLPIIVTGKNEPVYYSELTGDHARISPEKQGDYLEALAAYILSVFAHYYKRWVKLGFEVFTSEYNRYSYLRGKEVAIVDRSGNQLDQGTIRLVDSHGRLQLQKQDGTISPVTSGEVHLLF